MLVLMVGSQVRAQPATGLEGVWQISEIRFVRADGETVVSDPQPGSFIFTKSHYSATWISQAEPRRPFANRFEPTREELAAACDSLVVNSGRYEVSGDRLTVRPAVTRMPEFSGGRMIYQYAIDGNVLSLTVLDEYSRDGVQAPSIQRQRVTLKLRRVE
jgi:hypothetical protein